LEPADPYAAFMAAISGATPKKLKNPRRKINEA
jgi:hypothetical protein